jgi:hypothetical protein
MIRGDVMFYLLILALGLQTPAPVRVYVWTAKPAIVDLDQKDREDSVADVIKGLDKKVLVAVPQETSEIQIEVTKRSAVPTGGMNPANPKPYQFSETPVLERTVFATLRF